MLRFNFCNFHQEFLNDFCWKFQLQPDCQCDIRNFFKSETCIKPHSVTFESTNKQKKMQKTVQVPRIVDFWFLKKGLGTKNVNPRNWNIAKVFGPDVIYIYSIETVLFWENCFLIIVYPWKYPLYYFEISFKFSTCFHL